MREESMLTRGWVADGEAASCRAWYGEDKEAVAGGFHTMELGTVKPGDMLDLGVGGPVVNGENVSVVPVGLLVSVYDGEGGLPAVVLQEEVAGGGDAAPGTADGAAAEERFWWEADEYLPDYDLIEEAGEERRRSCCYGHRHGRPLGIGARPGSRSVPGTRREHRVRSILYRT
jgi:hypothetical protein